MIEDIRKGQPGIFLMAYRDESYKKEITSCEITTDSGNFLCYHKTLKFKNYLDK